MHPHRKRRLIALILVLTGLAIATTFILLALRDNINLYLTPSEVKVQHLQMNSLRLGGMVKQGSVQHHPQELAVDFVITDYQSEIQVHYSGVLPALFREGQGVVMDGQLNTEKEFTATRVLAKHDEKYMPPKIKDIAKKQVST